MLDILSKRLPAFKQKSFVLKFNIEELEQIRRTGLVPKYFTFEFKFYPCYDYDIFTFNNKTIKIDGYIRNFNTDEVYGYYNITYKEALEQIKYIESNKVYLNLSTYKNIPTHIKSHNNNIMNETRRSKLNIIPIDSIIFDFITLKLIKECRKYFNKAQHESTDSTIAYTNIENDELTKEIPDIIRKDKFMFNTIIDLRLIDQANNINKLNDDFITMLNNLPELCDNIPYYFIKEIGKGSYGRALLVCNKLNHRCYAVKCIKLAGLSLKNKIAALNEVKYLHMLRHKYIVNLEDSFLVNNYLCVVTEFCSRGDLYEKICNRYNDRKYLGLFKGYNEPQIAIWLAQLVLAIHYIHSKQIIHRDIKTGNIFISHDRSVRIGDFGISTKCSWINMRDKSIIGTPYYLAPEILESKPCTIAADIWALGCVLYELCTLSNPYKTVNEQQLKELVINSPAPSLPFHYSSSLKHIYKRMMDHNPLNRITADELLHTPYIKNILKTNYSEQYVNDAYLALSKNAWGIKEYSYIKKLSLITIGKYQHSNYALNKNPGIPVKLTKYISKSNIT